MQNAKNLLKTAKEYLSKKDVKLKQKYFWEISNFVKKLLEGIDQVTIDNYWLRGKLSQKGFKYIGNGVFEYKVVVKDVESS